MDISSSEFAGAYEHGYPKTVRFLLSRGLSPDLAEEIAQSGWARGWEKREQLQGVEKITAWVNQISLNMFRKQIARSAHQTTTIPPCRPEINSTVIDVRTALDRSSSRERELLRSYYLEGYSSDELGAREQCSPGAIRVRIMRAKHRVIENLSSGYHPGRVRRDPASTRRGRIAACFPGPDLAARVFDRDTDGHGGSLSVLRVDIDVAAEHRDPMIHAGESDAPDRLRRVHVETAPAVADSQDQPGGFAHQVDRHLRRARMFDHVEQQLAEDVKNHHAEFLRERDRPGGR